MNSLQNSFEDDKETLDIFANHKRKSFFNEVNSLAYYGNSGFPYDVVKNMPIYERRLNIQLINERIKNQKDINAEETNVLTDMSSTSSIKKISEKFSKETKTSDYTVPMKKK